MFYIYLNNCPQKDNFHHDGENNIFIYSIKWWAYAVVNIYSDIWNFQAMKELIFVFGWSLVVSFSITYF